MLTLKLALRNIPAHGQRNLIIAVVTALVSAFLFLFLTFSDGELENVKNGVAGFYDPPADLLAYHPDYWTAADHHQNTNEKTITGVPDLRKALEAFPGVREAVPAFWGNYLDFFARGHKYLGFNLIAVPGRNEFLHSRYTVTEGRDLAEGDRNVLLLHRTARESLPLRVGDEVTLVGKDYFGQMASLKVTLIGFYEPVMDNPNLAVAALVDVDAFGALAGYAPGEANRMLLRLQPGADRDRVLQALRAASGTTLPRLDFQVADSTHDRTGFAMVYGMVRILLVAMVVLTLLITGFGIMNVVSVNLHDRRKEIGTYFCLGSEKPFLMRLYTWEILFVNLGGAVAGLILGLGVRALVNALNITSTDPGFQVVVGGSRFVLGLSPSSFLWILGGVALITILTALTTLGKALDVAPVVAVRDAE
jgi:ABC-type lipoprotein release transport system permease subunit